MSSLRCAHLVNLSVVFALAAVGGTAASCDGGGSGRNVGDGGTPAGAARREARPVARQELEASRRVAEPWHPAVWQSRVAKAARASTLPRTPPIRPSTPPRRIRTSEMRVPRIHRRIRRRVPQATPAKVRMTHAAVTRAVATRAVAVRAGLLIRAAGTRVVATRAVATRAVATPAVATRVVATPAVATPAVATRVVATPAVGIARTACPTCPSGCAPNSVLSMTGRPTTLLVQAVRSHLSVSATIGTKRPAAERYPTTTVPVWAETHSVVGAHLPCGRQSRKRPSRQLMSRGRADRQQRNEKFVIRRTDGRASGEHRWRRGA